MTEKNYLAFDIEIARDFSKIPLLEFQPEPGEAVEVLWPRGDNIWLDAFYNGKDFVPASLEELSPQEKITHWRPVENKDWKRFRPLGITCAAAASSDGRLWNWWAHDGYGRFTPQMTDEQCRQMLATLGRLANEGDTILTFNGLGFDFDILAEESGEYQVCKRLALEHIDMMFHFFCSKGYPVGLDAAAKEMGLPGKPAGMDGAIAPALWAEGQYHKVLDYVSWDVKNTLALAQIVGQTGELHWTAHSGKPNTWQCERWLTVQNAMEIPEPDNSWMSDPWPREKFYGWTKDTPKTTV